MFEFRLGRGLRCAVAVTGLLVCGWMTWSAARAGLSRLLSAYGSEAGVLAAADAAAKLNPSDPRAHTARALIASDAGEVAAVREFERAVALRPRDFTLWLELGQARDQTGDAARAIEATREAVRLAPYYAQPRWQLGNLLLRAGRDQEAFSELRRAAAGNPTLWPQVIDLAYGLYGGDVRAVEQAVQPQNASVALALARLLARKGKTEAAMQTFRAAGSLSDHDRQDRQDQRMLLTDLLAAEQFREAYEVWASGRHLVNGGGAGSTATAAITDGGFEGALDGDDPGFGWRVARDVRALRVSLDTREPLAGARSLRLDWNGDSQPSLPVVTQLVLVKPGTSYRLSFGARARDVVTGGMPAVAVIDARRDGRLLSPPLLLSQAMGGWRKYSIEFVTAETTHAVLITIQRQNCSLLPCPIFGQTWFDEFTLKD